MFALPFLQPRHLRPLALFYSEWLAFVLGLAALSIFVLPRDTREFEVPRITLVPLALFVVLLIQLALGKAAYPQQIFLGAGYLVWAAALMVLGARLRREFGLPAMAATLAWFILAGGVLSALAAVLQHYEARGILEGVIATKIGPRAYGNLVQPNHMADYLSLALASLLFLHACGRLPLALAVLLAGLLLFALALTASIGAWLYVAAIGVVAALCFRQRKAAYGSLLYFSLTLIPAFAVAQWVAVDLLPSTATSFVSAAERLVTPDGGIELRLHLWRNAWMMFTQAPLLGVGFGQYTWHQFLLTGTSPSPGLEAYANHAHNILLQLLAELGAAGALMLIAGVLAWAWGLRRLAAELHNWWALVLLVILGIHSLLEFPLWYAYFLGIAAVLLGATDSGVFHLKMQPATRAGVAVLLVAAWFGALSLGRNYYVLEVSLFPSPEGTPQAELERKHRELLSVHGSLLTPYVELAVARALDLTTENIDRKIEFSNRVLRFAPTPVVSYQHAALLALKGEKRQALEFLDRAVAVYPGRLADYAREFSGLKGRDDAVVAAFRERIHLHLEAQRRLTGLPAGGGKADSLLHQTR